VTVDQQEHLERLGPEPTGDRGPGVTVVVFGSANVDLTVGAPRWPREGETLTGTSFTVGSGGKGLNQAVAAARLGARTAFVGRVGGDAYGSQLQDGLLAEGIDTADLVTDESVPSGVAVVLVDPDGRNRIVVVPGANGQVGPADVERVERRLRTAGVLLVQLELPLRAVTAAVEAAGRLGVRVLLDPAPVPAGPLPAALFGRHVVLTPNESEAAVLVGFDVADDLAAERAAQVLLARGAGGVLLKLGARGLLWATDLGLVRVPPFSVDVVDTVGAGDAVNGAFAAALAGGASAVDAARLAAVAGGLAVTRAGTQGAMPTQAELLAAHSRPRPPAPSLAPT
jgi:ribokinase